METLNISKNYKILEDTMYAKILGGEKSQTLTVASGCTRADTISLGAGKNTLTIGAQAGVVAGSVFGVATINLQSKTYKNWWKGQPKTFGGGITADRIVMDGGKASIKCGDGTRLEVGQLVLTEKNDSISIGKNARFSTESIDLAYGKDTITIGDNARVSLGFVTHYYSRGWGQNKNEAITIKVGRDATLTAIAADSGVYRVTRTIKASAGAELFLSSEFASCVTGKGATVHDLGSAEVAKYFVCGNDGNNGDEELGSTCDTARGLRNTDYVATGWVGDCDPFDRLDILAGVEYDKLTVEAVGESKLKIEFYDFNINLKPAESLREGDGVVFVTGKQTIDFSQWCDPKCAGYCGMRISSADGNAAAYRITLASK